MKDNLFDNRITILDVFKFIVLAYTAYATYTLITAISPGGGVFGFIRPVAAVLLVEGGLLFFERLSQIAKNEKQTRTAQGGHAFSIALIVLLACASVIAELTGAALDKPITFINLTMTIQEAAQLSAGVMLAAWVGIVLFLHLRFTAEDPDEQLRREKLESDGAILAERNQAYARAVTVVKPTLARAQAIEELSRHMENFDADSRAAMLAEANAAFDAHYGAKRRAALPAPAQKSSPLLIRPAEESEKELVPVPFGKNGNGHQDG
jgi:hypothetical protein